MKPCLAVLLESGSVGLGKLRVVLGFLGVMLGGFGKLVRLLGVRGGLGGARLRVGGMLLRGVVLVVLGCLGVLLSLLVGCVLLGFVCLGDDPMNGTLHRVFLGLCLVLLLLDVPDDVMNELLMALLLLKNLVLEELCLLGVEIVRILLEDDLLRIDSEIRNVEHTSGHQKDGSHCGHGAGREFHC